MYKLSAIKIMKTNLKFKQICNSTVLALLGLSVLTACQDRTHATDNATKPQVEIQSTQPLEAGKSVGSPNVIIDSNQNELNTKTDSSTSDSANNNNSPLINNNVTEPQNNPTENSLTNHQPDIVTSNVIKMTDGSPQATLVEAVNILYYGDAKDAVPYYETKIPNFEQELTNTQLGFQQSVKTIKITNVMFNKDQTMAKIEGEIHFSNGQPSSKAEFMLRKTDSGWKILG